MKSVTADDQKIKPLDAGQRTMLLPDIAVRLVLGGRVAEDGDLIVVSLEDEKVHMHREDYALARRVAGQIKGTWGRRKNATELLELVDHARKNVCDELFKPGLVRVLFYPSISPASAFFRCHTPALALNRGGKCVAHVSATKAAREALPYDVVVIQIDHMPATQQFAKALKEMGKRVIYEIDDAFDCLEPWHPNYAAYAQPERQRWVRNMMGIADAVTVTTPWLADRYREFTKKIEIVPNLLDVAAWPKAKPHGKPEFRVLWAGSPSHEGDWREAVPALNRFAREHSDVRLILFGADVPMLMAPEAQVERIPFVPFGEYPERLAAVAADVAIAPLADVPFNRGKSPIRVVQYMATGYPVVASDVEPHKGFRRAALCRNAREWLEALDSLYQKFVVKEERPENPAEEAWAFDVHKNVSRVEGFYSGLLA